MKTIKKILGALLSPRIWVMIILAVSAAYHFYPRVFHRVDTIMLLLVILGIAFLVFLTTALGTYDISSVEEFVKDIIMDVLYLIISVSCVVAGVFLHANQYSLGIIGIAIILSGADFVLSLKGGASKLLEMDKAQFQRTP